MPVAAHTPRPHDVVVEMSSSSAAPLQSSSMPSQVASEPAAVPGAHVSPTTPAVHVDMPVDDLARFVGDLREMRRVIGDALDRVAVEVAERGDAAGTRTLRADGYAFGLDAPTETVFSLDAALAELRPKSKPGAH